MREEDEMIPVRSERMGLRHVTLAHPTSLMCRQSPFTPVQLLELQASPNEEYLLQWGEPESQLRSPGPKAISFLAQDSRHFPHHSTGRKQTRAAPTPGNCSGGPKEGVQSLLPEGALEGNSNYLGPCQQPMPRTTCRQACRLLSIIWTENRPNKRQEASGEAHSLSPAWERKEAPRAGLPARSGGHPEARPPPPYPSPSEPCSKIWFRFAAASRCLIPPRKHRILAPLFHLPLVQPALASCQINILIPWKPDKISFGGVDLSSWPWLPGSLQRQWQSPPVPHSWGPEA